eukprot:2724045-Pyramimonas_sp.AAC.1
MGGASEWAAFPNATVATGAFGGAPNGATKRVRGMSKLAAFSYATVAIGIVGEAPCGTTKRVRGARCSRMQPLPLDTS